MKIYCDDWAIKKEHYISELDNTENVIKLKQLKKGDIVLAESMPLKQALKFKKKCVILKTIAGYKVAQVRKSKNGVKSDENDSKIYIPNTYHLYPEKFMEYDFDKMYTKAFIVTFLQMEKEESAMKNRNKALENDKIAKLIDNRHKDIYHFKKELKKKLKNNVVFSWSFKQKGIGVEGASKLTYDIYKASYFATKGKIWKYFGLHVENGKAVKKEKGKSLDFLPGRRARIRVITKILVGDCRNKNCTNPLYQDYYNKRLEKRLKEVDTEFHAKNMALRETAKFFLKNLWKECRKVEGDHYDRVKNQNIFVSSTSLHLTVKEDDHFSVEKTIYRLSPLLHINNTKEVN